MREPEVVNEETVEVIIRKERKGTKEFTQIVQRDSGELVDQFWRTRMGKQPGAPPTKNVGKKANFYRIYCTNWADIIDHERLSIPEIGFFMVLLRFVGWGSNVLVHPKTLRKLSVRDLAVLLRINRSTLTSMITQLGDKGFLAVVSDGEKRASHIVLNSQLVFKGAQITSPEEAELFLEAGYSPPVIIHYEPDIRGEKT